MRLPSGFHKRAFFVVRDELFQGPDTLASEGDRGAIARIQDPRGNQTSGTISVMSSGQAVLILIEHFGHPTDCEREFGAGAWSGRAIDAGYVSAVACE
jgi:hypothetical protein